jgi:DNA-binding beta-propeller fold protein YncE
MLSRRIIRRWLIGIAAVAAVVTFGVGGNWSGTPGEARLVAFESLVNSGAGETCEWEVAAPQYPSFAASFAAPGAAVQLPAANARLAVAGRQPLTFIQDPYPSFSSIAVDPVRNEIVMTDENRFRIMVYDRLATTPASAEQTTPKRVISGLNTHTQYASDVYIDPPSGEIYVINNDTVHNTTIWGREAKGDAPPDREFVSPYGNFGAAVDESRQEMYLTLQHNSAIMVYKKSSGMQDHAVRLIQGDKTRMADPHGIAFDPKNRLLYVANYGTSHSVKMGATGPGGRPRVPNWPAGNYGSEIIKGTGKFELPSITVLSADATGDVAPLRVIQGPKTGLNWATGVAFDAERGELYVANAIGDNISVFGANQQGDVAPIRVLKGARTLLKYPSDVFLDMANNEMWVASYGNHLALAYKLGASGDTAPVRVIRGAPLNTPATLIGNPFSIAYDTRREEILVPSCVAHPRIAAFARTADKNAVAVRAIQGSKTHLNRTVHAIVYDEIHDEIHVTSDIGQALMTFRGAANGDEAPIRVIQGPRSGIGKVSKLSADPVNNEIITWSGGQIMFWDRLANGDVPPKRVLGGPDTMLGANNVSVDPIHGLLIVSGGSRILIFDRTASGNTKPKAVIGGPRSGLMVGQGMTVYPPTGKIIVNVPGFREDDRDEGDAFSPEGLASDKSYVGVWSIYDNGDVPPQWTIGGPNGLLRQPRGVTLDPKNRNLIVSDKFLNGVATYHFPELFEPDTRQTARAQR